MVFMLLFLHWRPRYLVCTLSSFSTYSCIMACFTFNALFRMGADLNTTSIWTPGKDTQRVRQGRGKGTTVLQSMKLGVDVNRHKEIIVKAISAVLLLLLKHFKLNHIYQGRPLGKDTRSDGGWGMGGGMTSSRSRGKGSVSRELSLSSSEAEAGGDAALMLLMTRMLSSGSGGRPSSSRFPTLMFWSCSKPPSVNWVSLMALHSGLSAGSSCCTVSTIRYMMLSSTRRSVLSAREMAGFLTALLQAALSNRAEKVPTSSSRKMLYLIQCCTSASQLHSANSVQQAHGVRSVLGRVQLRPLLLRH
ncbi:hypothetical protein CRUP_005024 [Coryphaenoides rupestris]|nr:hypothetical protein CRUP_005024 [Coryphaenoides rupestris]